ncbi:hypothetical protein [Methylobacterium oryzisoli]|uniref:hypothetical protein n=1 Tax=Methylobacterium oryzisoli TaxID=3385502 RepID=UPI0038925525
MVVALYALALLMVVGGLASVVQGIPYVRLEIGWTMVIAGTVAASGGSVLLGLAAVVARLQRMERLMGQGAALSAPTRSLPPLPPVPAPEPTPSPVASALGQAGVAGAAALAATDLRPSRTAPEVAAPELRLTRAEPDEATREEPRPAESKPAEPEPIPAEPEPIPEPEAARATEPELEATVAETAPPAEPEPPAAPEPPSIVGTYASGGNTYVMYSDGTIDADTPGGKFHFHSLDELKVFIAEGGEAGGGARSGTA